MDAAKPGVKRVAVVTGASSGIGRAIGRAFGDLGWGVAVGARGEEGLRETSEQISAAGGRPFAHLLDVTDSASIEEFFEAAEGELGPASVVINNAAVAVPGRLHQMSVEHVTREVTTALLGSLLVTRRALQPMLSQDLPGDVVFITSAAAVQDFPLHVPYSAAKAGLEQAVRSLRVELEGTGIRVQYVRSGPCGETDFAQAWLHTPEGRDAIDTWKRHGLIKGGGTRMTPAHVANAVVACVTMPEEVQFDAISIAPMPPRFPGAG